MSNFFKKRNSDSEEPEDFVLFNSDNDEDAENTSALETIEEDEQKENENQHTISINIGDIESELGEPYYDFSDDEPLSAESSESRFGSLGGLIKKHRALSICICSVLIIAIIAGSAFGILTLSNPLHGYAQVAAEKGSIMRTFDVSGTLESGDKYEITSLVSGKILESDFGIGDTVKKGDLLYKIDDTEAQLAVDRAENEVARAKDDTAGSDFSSPTTYKIIASEAGTVQTLGIKTGSMVSPGSQVGTLKKADGTTSAIVCYVSGSIAAVSVREGQSLSPGQIIATINPTNTTTQRNTTYDKKSSEIDLQSAQRHLENYEITSPVDGIIVEKNIKAGDNVGITDSNKPMMVVVDTSHLTFTFSVDEYKIREFKKGQTVSVKTDSIPDTDFSGEVTAVSNEGVLNDEGVPMYNVTVTINEPKDLKSGMKVSGTVVLDSKKNVLSVPEKALMESDGRNALVLVKSTDAKNADADVSETLENELNYPWIKIPKGCKLVSVKYGLSDGTSVQILSGLSLGDIVVYDPENDSRFVTSTLTDDSESEDISNDKLDNDSDEDNADTDEALQREIEEQINKMQHAL